MIYLYFFYYPKQQSSFNIELVDAEDIQVKIQEAIALHNSIAPEYYEQLHIENFSDNNEQEELADEFKRQFYAAIANQNRAANRLG